LLEQDETIDLIKLAQNGDVNAKSMLVENNSPLIKSIIKRFRGRGVEYEDLFQLGCIGMLKAISNFSTDFNVRFSTYAVPMIIGEIKRYMRDDGMIKVSRAIKALSVKINCYIEEFKSKNNKSPQINEIASALEVEPQEIAVAMDAGKVHISLYDKGEDDQGLSVIDRVSAVDDSDELLDKIIVRDAIMSLSDRERKIITLRYYKDKTQSEVAKILNVSQVQISRLENKIIDKIKTSFQ